MVLSGLWILDKFTVIGTARTIKSKSPFNASLALPPCIYLPVNPASSPFKAHSNQSPVDAKKLVTE